MALLLGVAQAARAQPVAVCGNGTLEAPELCDDGNLVDGDGCDSNCTPTACGNGITTSGEACDDGGVADGDGCSGVCVIEPGWRCSGRPSVCTEICGDGILTRGEQCDDANTISRDGCSSTCRLELCTVAPASGCRQPLATKAGITLKHRAIASSDLLAWKWAQSGTTPKTDFGSPTSGTSYAICIYDDADGAGRLKLSSTVPAGGFCGRNPCWRDKGESFVYGSRDLAADGIAKMTLVATPASTKLTVKGKGIRLATPVPSGLVLPLRVQLKNSAGVCWEARFSAPVSKQTADLFKDKSD